MEPILASLEPSIIIIIDGNSYFNYLIDRYADRVGCSVKVAASSESVETIQKFKPVTVVFASVENLGESQSLVVELNNRDIPIIVCSPVADQDHARELGADYCLLHPLMYDGFSTVLRTVMSRGKHRMDTVQMNPEQYTRAGQV